MVYTIEVCSHVCLCLKEATTPYMVYTIEPVVRGWVLDAGGEKEILPSLVEAKQRALEDHVSRAKQALRIKGWKYDERIGGV